MTSPSSRDHRAQGAVGRRVGGPEVEHLGLEVVVVLLRPRAPSSGIVVLALGQQPALAGVVVLAQGVALEGLVGQDALEVGVALEADAEHVVGLALEPVGRLPHAVDGRHRRVVLGAPAP